MVIILRNASLTNLAVIGSLRLPLHALQANLPGFIQEQSDVAFLLKFGREKESEIEEEHDAEHDSLHQVEVSLMEDKEPMVDDESGEGGEQEDNRDGHTPFLGLIL